MRENAYESAAALSGINIEESHRLARLCASWRLRKLSRQLTRHYDRYLHSTGVTAAQMPILTFVYGRKSCTITEIAERLDLDRSTLSRNLNVLSRRDLVTLTGGRGRLPASVRLTPTGSKAFRRALRAWNMAQDELQEIGPLHELIDALDIVERFAKKTS